MSADTTDPRKRITEHMRANSKLMLWPEPQSKFPPAVIANETMPALAGFINTLKVQHYREAAVALRRHDHDAAALLLEHTADDLTDELSTTEGAQHHA